jgi:glutathione S-transferase
MVLKLYAHNMSTCGRRVATILVEKKVPFKLLPAENIKGEAWLEHQPVSRCVRRSNFTLN